MKEEADWNQRYDGDWQPVCKVEYLGCCDCGLVHRVETRYRLVDGKKVLQSRYFRDNRRTAQIRRHKGVKVVVIGNKKR
jgi:hypothetical protein